jgi:redox-sensitive bicupin YhaK (pirin superfamily)
MNSPTFSDWKESMSDTIINPRFVRTVPLQHFPADAFPIINPIFWLNSHFAVGGGSPLQRLSGMYTAHMTRISPQNGFTWHPHRGLEIFTWVLEGTLFHQDSTGGEGELKPGDVQRMFSGDLILHQELNNTDEPVRVIQIWFAADPKHRKLPHYEQLNRSQLPKRRHGDANVLSVFGDDSPLERHMVGDARLTATFVPPSGKVEIEPPREGEDLFLYVTEGTGDFHAPDMANNLGQYDVLLARPDAKDAIVRAAPDQELHFLNFYLPKFLS